MERRGWWHGHLAHASRGRLGPALAAEPQARRPWHVLTRVGMDLDTEKTTMPMWTKVVVSALVGLGLLAGGAKAADPSLLSQAGPEDKALYAAAKEAMLAEAKSPPLILNKTNEAYFWRVSARMTPLLKAHAYSKEPGPHPAVLPHPTNRSRPARESR